MHAGAKVDYRLALFGVPFRWRTRISEWNPPRSFVDQQVRGPYAQWTHTHRFFAEKDGTRMEDIVDYALPFGTLGRIVLPLVRRQLERIFDYRSQVIVQIFNGERS